MFDGFRPELQGWFFERRIGPSVVALSLLLGGASAYVLLVDAKEKTVEVALADPQLEDFAVEKEPEEEEPLPEEEPPPPPPPDAKVKVVKKPTPRPKPQTPISKPDEAAEETDAQKVHEVVEGGATSKAGSGAGLKKPAAPKKPAVKNAPPPPKKTKKKKAPLDPTKPVDRPEKATVPRPLASNAQPSYPKSLRDEGITGRIVIKLHVHRDGVVRGAKVLSKKTSATTEDEQKAAAKAFLQAILKVVKGWKFEPATLEGQPISVWHKVTIPFELTD